MTCRYAHKRIALLFTVIHETPAARVIEWPQASQGHTAERRQRQVSTETKSEQEESYACK